MKHGDLVAEDEDLDSPGIFGAKRERDRPKEAALTPTEGRQDGELINSSASWVGPPTLTMLYIGCERRDQQGPIKICLPLGPPHHGFPTRLSCHPWSYSPPSIRSELGSLRWDMFWYRPQQLPRSISAGHA